MTQRYQEVSAHARLNGVPTQVWEAKLAGDRLSFVVVDTTDRENETSLYFDGRVSGDVIEGEVARGVGSRAQRHPVARGEGRRNDRSGREPAGVAGAAAALLVALPSLSPAADQHPHADVPYVPTPPGVVDAMLGIAGVGPEDYVIDLGSGDGRIVIAAAKQRGARGIGVEIDGGLVSTARREAQREGVAGLVEFMEQNLFMTEIRPGDRDHDVPVSAAHDAAASAAVRGTEARHAHRFP